MMKRIIAFAFLVGVCCPSLLFGQIPLPTLIPAGTPSLPSMGDDAAGFVAGLPLIRELKAGKISLNPSVQVGYQQIGANMSIPIRADAGVPAGQLQVGTLDVSLNSFNFWSGTVGLNIVAGPLTLFGSAGGFLPHVFQLSGQIPISLGAVAGTPQFEMTASNFQFWTIQGGVGYAIGSGYSILGGIMWSHMAVEFSDPRNAAGPLANQTIRGDVLLKTGVPFIGIQILQQGSYRGAILYSPIAWSSGAMDFRSSQQTLVDLNYSLNQPGKFLAFSGEYYFLFKPPVVCSMWFNASLVNIKGTSELEFTSAGPAASRSNDVVITNTQYSIGGGFTFALAF